MNIKLILFTFTLSCLANICFAQADPLANAHALYRAGKFAEAKALYQKNIRVPGARAYIHRCDVAIKKGIGKQTAKSKLASVVVPTIQLEDVPVRDALSYLSKKVTEISNGKTLTNIIYSGTKAQADNTYITLTLRQTPADAVLEYICKAANCEPRYDEFAVVVTPVANLPQKTDSETTGTLEPNTTGSGSKSDIF